MSIKKVLPGFQENVPLKKITSFRIGGPAHYFFVCKKEADLIKAIKTAKKNNLLFFVLGASSNVLFSDKGFNGLVIKNEVKEIKINKKNSNFLIRCGAGLELSALVKLAEREGLTGLEWASGIPGTVGGAIWGNAGASGKSIGGVVKNVSVFDFNKEKNKDFKARDCSFGYRDSIFKKRENLIVLSAEIQLRKGDKKKISQEIKRNLSYRIKTQPLKFPSIGSIFKNPPGFSAGSLIEQCGLKGFKRGMAQVSKKHANFIVNLGGAKAKEVIDLIKIIKGKVKNKFGINLKEEIKIITPK